jgi:hypothetical protein
MRALIDELERDDADDYWSSGCARAQVVGVDERAAIGMLALAAAWESSGATAGALGVALHLSATVSFGPRPRHGHPDDHGAAQPRPRLRRRAAAAESLIASALVHAGDVS